MTSRSIGLLAAFVLLASCGGGDDAPAGPFPGDAFALAASSDLAVGRERLLVAVAGSDGSRLASPDIPVTVAVRPEGRQAGDPVDAVFIWAVPGHSGLYRANVDFDSAGTWWVTVTPVGARPLDEFPVTVHTDSGSPGVGDPAPQSASATAADGALETITTDDDPDPRFYELSVGQAVTSGRPTVIVFATPKFCTTGVCGPTLDDVKALAPSYPDVNFVHVEVFTNLDDPTNLQVVPAVDEWGLLTEPWVFVVDAAGIVAGRFEGVVAPEEIVDLLG